MTYIGVNRFLFLIIFSAISFPEYSKCDSEKRTIVSCCWNGEFRLHLIPNPYSCVTFHQCEPELRPDGRYRTVPTLQPCPLDENGKRQHFDIQECRCLRENEALCFDHQLPGHPEAFFNCTVPFYVEGIHVKCS